MNIGFITTIDTNIGDDFIRTGIENIISSLRNPSKISYTYVNKHKPETSLRKGSIMDRIYRLPNFKGKGRIVRFFENNFYAQSSVYARQELIIQSGAPVLWPNCQYNEWAYPIWYNTIGKLKDKIPVLNLAAGSCYPWEKKQGFQYEGEKKYAKDIASFCKLTTTRDELAHNLFNSVGASNILLPCTAFFVAKEFDNPHQGSYILINYMSGGGHFDWDQNIDHAAWDRTLHTVITELVKEHEVRFICHSDNEANIARAFFPGLKIHCPSSVTEYLDVIRSAKLGINNRMHASVAMASVGVQAISICTDTRLLMLDKIGQPIYYVKDVNSSNLLETCQHLLKDIDKGKEKLFQLKKATFEQYQTLLKPYVAAV